MNLRSPPAAPTELRAGLYAGNIYRVAANPCSLRLVESVHTLLVEALGPRIREAPAALAPEDFFARMGAIRRELFTKTDYLDQARGVIAAAGFDPGQTAFDPLRLRVIQHNGHENPRAKPVYYPHRDTWYAHPQGIVTWWIPLHDLEPHETFVFYPELFSAPVPNDSEIFDYDQWVAKGWSLKIGWQDIEAGRTAQYPQTDPEFLEATRPSTGFACQRGENILFSGAHFHRTLPQTTGLCRYSLDFRVVDLSDHAAGRGAPNVDNRSRGSALPDYCQPRSRG